MFSRKYPTPTARILANKFHSVKLDDHTNPVNINFIMRGALMVEIFSPEVGPLIFGPETRLLPNLLAPLLGLAGDIQIWE